MVKLILISLQIIIAFDAVLSKNVPAGNGLEYIGSFRSKLGVQGRSVQSFDVRNYYISQNSGAWNSAKIDCQKKLNASLLAVETKEEWEFVRGLIEDNGFVYIPGKASDYWTSGMYANSKWRWSVNDVPLAPFAPWEKGNPSKMNSGLRVLMHFDEEIVTWSTLPYTQLHRYICTSSAQPCYKMNDLVIVLESSGNFGRNSFEKAKQFVERLASAFTVYSSSRVAFITYSHSATTHIAIDLSSTLSTAEISSQILTTQFEAGSTATHLGIKSATEELLLHYRGAPMNIVVLTNGESSSPSMTIDAAKEAIHWGIRTYSVGITPYVNRHELLEIAGNDASRMFTTDHFDNLIDLLAPLSAKMCSP